MNNHIRVREGEDYFYNYIDITTLESKNFFPLRVLRGKTTKAFFIEIRGRKIRFTKQELVETLEIIEEFIKRWEK